MGAETPRGTYHKRITDDANKIISLLDDSADCVFPGIVYSMEDIQKAQSIFVESSVDCVLCVFMSWTEDEIWIRFLRDNDRFPMIYYRSALDGAAFPDCDTEDGFVELLSNHGLVGSLVGSGSVQKMGRYVEVIVGRHEESRARILSCAKMCMVRSVLREARFGLMGAYNEVMWNTYIDPYRLFLKGPSLTFTFYSELQASADAIGDEEVREYKRVLEEKYAVDDDVEEHKFLASVRYSLAMARVMEDKGIDVLSFNDVDYRLFEMIGLRPSFYPEKLNDKPSLIVPEGDLGAAYIAYVLKLTSGKAVNLIEPFYIDAKNGLFAGGHAGPNDYNTITDPSNVKISVDARFAKTNYRFAGAPFAWIRFPAGTMTMAGLSECNGRYKIICGLVESLPGQHFINGYSHSTFKPVNMCVNEYFEKILTIGSTQHFVITHGDFTQDLEYFAKIRDLDYYNINRS